MAEPCAQQSSYRNAPPTGINEVTSASPIKGNSTLTLTSVVSRISNPAPAPLFAHAQLVSKNTNVNLQKATKLAL